MATNKNKMKKTIFITGPSGIGKSPLDYSFKSEEIIKKIDPYRLRKNPRNPEDVFYGHPNLKDDFLEILKRYETKDEISNSDLIWFSDSKVLFFNVRGTWQIMTLQRYYSPENKLLKAEIYAPILPKLFLRENFRNIFGEIYFIILNPTEQSYEEMNDDLSNIEKQTHSNLEKVREPDIPKRVGSLAEEVSSWKAILGIEGINKIEIKNWKYAEFTYIQKNHIDVPNNKLLGHQVRNLLEAKECLLNESQNVLVDFFLSDSEIGKINNVFVNYRS